jgi:hypothetical protein
VPKYQQPLVWGPNKRRLGNTPIGALLTCKQTPHDLIIEPAFFGPSEANDLDVSRPFYVPIR